VYKGGKTLFIGFARPVLPDHYFVQFRYCGMEALMKAVSIACLFMVFAVLSPGSAWARGGHGGGWGGHGGWGHGGWGHGYYYGGIGLGLGYGLGYYGYPYYNYNYPYYGYPPVINTAPAVPPVYIQQQPAPQAQAQNYWHYCRNPAGYYPYVKACPGGWQQVSPVPPDHH
jgi:hypothetical protein